jgi:hypothetical protein
MELAQSGGSRVKGYALLSYVAPLKRDKSELWRRMVQCMSGDGRAFFEGEIYANAWYPRSHLHDLMRAFGSATQNRAEDLRELGGMAARYQLHVIYRIFLKFATPALVFNRAASVWSRQSTQGTFRVVEEHPDHLIGELEDADLPPGIPDLIAGWSDTIIAMLGRTPYPTTWERLSHSRYRFKVSWIKR